MSNDRTRPGAGPIQAGDRPEAIVVELAERLHCVRAERDAALRAVEEIEAVIRKVDPEHPCLGRRHANEGTGNG
ncbi:hypothetical protein V474_22775 [Novosphingobium barchaimii LL02]|uniref:Uncharacterized protein n=1 Tax=Novosphingobium barchaimii LL02 TaxID=1114963 RepID=A0A0J7XPK7_9SPHN|nr:hypothetical protein [Novosphingobium barchaimii]KMS53607.1 hypothetical protein V474_22775 [Novosphingobium barchaimii LL02]